MINIKDKTKCSGCSACAQACPQKCITMVADNEGFMYPRVDESSCVDCGICERVCQYIFPFDSKNTPINTYAYVISDEYIRSESSSGGAFTTIADYILSKGGKIYGASFDNDWNVILSSADTLEGLSFLRKSKYVQASVGNTYAEVKTDLKNNRLVLFVSTPCQINGLNHYLGKEYDNLFTIDFTCHGIPSPKVWRDYIKKYTNKGISYINFRNKKKNGWNNYSLEINDKTGKPLLLQGNKQNLYMRGFLQDLYCRPSCSNCVSRNFSTKCDIMIGDFWNIEQYHKEDIYNDNNGVSLCMTLSKKGEELINCLNANGTFLKVPFKEAEANDSHSCILRSFSPHKFRSVFFKYYGILPLRILIWLLIVPYNCLRKVYSNTVIKLKK